eukprot:3862430-Ditylum_brightwellii.AAC.2
MRWHMSYLSAAEDVMGTVASDNAEQDRRVSLIPHGWGSIVWCSLVSSQELHWCNGPIFPSS